MHPVHNLRTGCTYNIVSFQTEFLLQVLLKGPRSHYSDQPEFKKGQQNIRNKIQNLEMNIVAYKVNFVEWEEHRYILQPKVESL